MAALESLDEATRHAIVLRHFSGLSFIEIADIMNCPIGTVLARVHRGLKTLRSMLDRQTPSAVDELERADKHEKVRR